MNILYLCLVGSNQSKEEKKAYVINDISATWKNVNYIQ